LSKFLKKKVYFIPERYLWKKNFIY
jgi:hypothetical protein